MSVAVLLFLMAWAAAYLLALERGQGKLAIVLAVAATAWVAAHFGLHRTVAYPAAIGMATIMVGGFARYYRLRGRKADSPPPAA